MTRTGRPWPRAPPAPVSPVVHRSPLTHVGGDRHVSGRTPQRPEKMCARPLPVRSTSPRRKKRAPPIGRKPHFVSDGSGSLLSRFRRAPHRSHQTGAQNAAALSLCGASGRSRPLLSRIGGAERSDAPASCSAGSRQRSAGCSSPQPKQPTSPRRVPRSAPPPSPGGHAPEPPAHPPRRAGIPPADDPTRHACSPPQHRTPRPPRDGTARVEHPDSALTCRFAPELSHNETNCYCSGIGSSEGEPI